MFLLELTLKTHITFKIITFTLRKREWTLSVALAGLRFSERVAPSLIYVQSLDASNALLGLAWVASTNNLRLERERLI